MERTDGRTIDVFYFIQTCQLASLVCVCVRGRDGIIVCSDLELVCIIINRAAMMLLKALELNECVRRVSREKSNLSFDSGVSLVSEFFDDRFYYLIYLISSFTLPHIIRSYTVQ